jgi:hypothetical protein
VTRIRSSAAFALAASLVVGCGGGGGGGQSTSSSAPTTPATTQAAPAPTTTTTTPAPAPTSTTPAKPPRPSTSSTVPGGSEPARTELAFTGSKSGVSPRHASVAPFVAVRVSLVSADHSAHRLVIGGHALKVGGTLKSMFVELPGLRPGRSYKGTADGRVKITILSSNEPGP